MNVKILSLFPLFLVACDGGETKESDTGLPSGDCVEENGACVLTGTYTDSMTLTADKAWLLRGGVQIGDGASSTVLTIEPGTKIYGENATGGFLVINRGSQIQAVGEASNPIVFTTDLAEGSRDRGSWGGVVINGRAPINACSDGAADCEAEGEGGTGIYGGSDAADNSGTLKYVRIEFGGIEISPDNEINGLSLQGVGSGTTVDYVQVHKNLDDGVEIFGGAVNIKHIVITGPGDDGLDWDLGWQGNGQFIVVQQHSDAGNNGIEADNNEENHSATPGSSPTISNLTLFGSESIAEDNFGILLRRGTAASLWNVAIDSFSLACVAIRDQETFDHFTAGTSSFNHTVLGCTNSFEEDAEETETVTEEQAFGMGMGNTEGADLGLVDAGNQTAPNFLLGSGSALSSGGMTPSGSFFESVSYVGAFDGSNDWTTGWTAYSAK